MDATFATVGVDARGHLNDIDVPGGEYATDSVLQTHRERAYRELYDIMTQAQTSRIKRVVYWLVPAYSQMLSPVGHMGLKDVAEPLWVEERNSLTTVPILSTDTNSPIVVTTPEPHTLSTNQEITVMGVIGTTAPWGRWYVTVLNPTQFYLNSSVSDGLSGNSGVICWSNERFTQLEVVDRTHDCDISDKLRDYFWDEGVFKFRGANTDRQLRITYRASGAPPSLLNQPIGLDNCSNFLGCRTACFMANAKGWYQMADRLELMAVGQSRMADGSGGFLRGFINSQTQAMQREARQRGFFRRKRLNVDWYLL